MPGASKQPASDEWHLLIGDRQYGPLSFDDVVDFVEKNGVRPDDYVWRPGWPEWKTLDAVLNEPPPTRQPAPPPLPQRQMPGVRAEDSFSGMQPQANYFLRHWRGDLSLGITYWLNFFLPSLVTALGISTLAFLNWSGGFRFGGAIAVASSLFFLLLFVWQVVGLWRSASKHTARGGKRIWALLAQAVVILTLLYFASMLYRTAQIVFRSTPAERTTRKANCPDLKVSHLLDPGTRNLVLFRVDLRPHPKPEPEKFFWSISSGAILSGQSTEGIVVQAPSGLVTATVEVMDLPADCPRISSGTATMP